MYELTQEEYRMLDCIRRLKVVSVSMVFPHERGVVQRLVEKRYVELKNGSYRALPPGECVK